jgi:hypothetical protein
VEPSVRHRRRLARSTGALGVAYGVVSIAMFALLGKVPDVGGAGSLASGYFSDHRGALLAASILLVLAGSLSVAFFAALRRLVAWGGPSPSADVGMFGALLVFAMAGVAAGALQCGALLAGAGGLDPSRAGLLEALVVAIVNLSAGPTLILAAGFGLALRRSEGLGQWASWSLFAVGFAHLGALASVAHRGPLAPGAALSYLGPVLFLLWVVAVGAALISRSARSAADDSQ